MWINYLETWSHWDNTSCYYNSLLNFKNDNFLAKQIFISCPTYTNSVRSCTCQYYLGKGDTNRIGSIWITSAKVVGENIDVWSSGPARSMFCDIVQAWILLVSMLEHQFEFYKAMSRVTCSLSPSTLHLFSFSETAFTFSPFSQTFNSTSDASIIVLTARAVFSDRQSVWMVRNCSYHLYHILF